MVFGMEASFNLSYTCYKGIRVTPNIRVLPSETLSQILDLENFATASRLSLGAVNEDGRRRGLFIAPAMIDSTRLDCRPLMRYTHTV